VKREEEVKQEGEVKEEREVRQNEETTIEDGVIVNPYTIENATNKEIDYNKLIDRFGCYYVDKDIIDRIERLTKQPAHYYIRRGIFFAHRELDLILNAY
jgi:tryptophanyl-tRNA synthetase